MINKFEMLMAFRTLSLEERYKALNEAFKLFNEFKDIIFPSKNFKIEIRIKLDNAFKSLYNAYSVSINPNTYPQNTKDLNYCLNCLSNRLALNNKSAYDFPAITAKALDILRILLESMDNNRDKQLKLEYLKLAKLWVKNIPPEKSVDLHMWLNRHEKELLSPPIELAKPQSNPQIKTTVECPATLKKILDILSQENIQTIDKTQPITFTLKTPTALKLLALATLPVKLVETEWSVDYNSLCNVLINSKLFSAALTSPQTLELTPLKKITPKASDQLVQRLLETILITHPFYLLYNEKGINLLNRLNELNERLKYLAGNKNQLISKTQKSLLHFQQFIKEIDTKNKFGEPFIEAHKNTLGRLTCLRDANIEQMCITMENNINDLRSDFQPITLEKIENTLNHCNKQCDELTAIYKFLNDSAVKNLVELHEKYKKMEKSKVTRTRPSDLCLTLFAENKVEVKIREQISELKSILMTKGEFLTSTLLYQTTFFYLSSISHLLSQHMASLPTGSVNENLLRSFQNLPKNLAEIPCHFSNEDYILGLEELLKSIPTALKNNNAWAATQECLTRILISFSVIPSFQTEDYLKEISFTLRTLMDLGEKVKNKNALIMLITHLTTCFAKLPPALGQSINSKSENYFDACKTFLSRPEDNGLIKILEGIPNVLLILENDSNFLPTSLVTKLV